MAVSRVGRSSAECASHSLPGCCPKPPSQKTYMKTHHFKHTAAIAAIMLGLGSGAVVQAQNTGGQGWGRTQGNRSPVMAVSTPTADAETFGFDRVAGRVVRGSGGEELGTVVDALMDPQSGRVRFGLVPSGTGASGLTFRMVPVTAGDPNARSSNDLVLRLNQGQWNQVGTSSESEVSGRVTLNPDVQRRLSDQFQLTGEDARASAQLLRVSQLKNLPVRSGNDQLGTIEDVFIDSRRNASIAVLKPTGNFSNGAQLYLVPMNRLQFSADAQTAITTNLTRSDFQQAQMANSNLTPTGYPQGQGQQSGHQPADGAAAAVQQALSRTQAGAGVQVVPESRLVLRGTVQNEQQKAQIQQAANQAAPGVRIDNEITIRGW